MLRGDTIYINANLRMNLAALAETKGLKSADEMAEVILTSYIDKERNIPRLKELLAKSKREAIAQWLDENAKAEEAK